MKITLLYSVILLFLVCSPFTLAQKVYKGKVNVFQHVAKKEKGYLFMNMEISICALPVGKHQSMLLMPMLKAGKDSLVMQPIVLNGVNKQKMYDRAFSLHGKCIADDGAYVVVQNYPRALQQIVYEQKIPYRKWMENAELILVGQLCNYDGYPVKTYMDILTEKIRITK